MLRDPRPSPLLPTGGAALPLEPQSSSPSDPDAADPRLRRRTTIASRAVSAAPFP